MSLVLVPVGGDVYFATGFEQSQPVSVLVNHGNDDIDMAAPAMIGLTECPTMGTAGGGNGDARP